MCALLLLGLCRRVRPGRPPHAGVFSICGCMLVHASESLPLAFGTVARSAASLGGPQLLIGRRGFADQGLGDSGFRL